MYFHIFSTSYDVGDYFLRCSTQAWRGPGLVKGHFFEIRLRFWLRLGFAFGLLINSGFSWNEWREQNCEFHVWAGHRLRAAKMQINPNEWQKNTQKWNREYMSKYKRACSWSPFHYVKTWHMDVCGIWLRFWCSGFALQGFDQIVSRKSTPHKDEELNLFACSSYPYPITNLENPWMYGIFFTFSLFLW